MVRAVVDVHILDELTAEAVFGKHTLHHVEEEGVHAGFEVLVVRFLHQHFGGRLALTAGVAGVTKIDFIGHLIAGEDDLVGVDDDDVVAALHVGGVAGLVLAAENFGDFGTETAEHLIGGIDDNPFLFDACGVGGDCFVA